MFRKRLLLFSIFFSICFVFFQNFTTLDASLVDRETLSISPGQIISDIDFHQKWAQGIWNFEDDPSLFLLSQDPDGRDGHEHVYFHLIRKTLNGAKTLVSFDLPAGTHAQSIYAVKLTEYRYNIFTENQDRRGLSWFELRFGKYLPNTTMSYKGDIYPKDSQGRSLFFHLFGVNSDTGTLALGSINSEGITLQRYDAESFFKPISTEGGSFRSLAIPRYESIKISGLKSFQGLGLLRGKAYILSGPLSLGDQDKNLHVLDFKSKNLTHISLINVWNKNYSAEPEGLFVQNNELIFGVQGFLPDNANPSLKKASFKIFTIPL